MNILPSKSIFSQSFSLLWKVLIFISVFYSEINAQIIIGDVKDKNGISINNARISLLQKGSLVQESISNDQGQFVFQELNSGIFFLNVSAVGYAYKSVQVFVKENEYINVNIVLEEMVNISIDSLTVFASNLIAQYDGDITMLRSQYKTMTASFQDPSRVVINFPGFSTDNDGTNNFIFRGLPSYATSWQMYNTEIVNPNHLATAGNRGDAQSLNGGGVNAISGSVIDYYEFAASPTNISLSNTLGGSSNIKLASKTKPFVDISLIGVEAGAGNSWGNKNTYATARYSFVGLLEKLGVPFGDESINYQDATIFSDLIKNERSYLKGFLIFGASSNKHKAFESDREKTSIKDFKNIDYQSQLFIGGLNYTLLNKKNQTLNVNLVYSRRKDIHIENIDTLYAMIYDLPALNNKRTEGILSSHTNYNLKIQNHNLVFGLRTAYQTLLVSNQQEKLINNHRLYPYMDWHYPIFKNLIIKTGLGGHIYSGNFEGLTNTLNGYGEISYPFTKNWNFVVSSRYSDFFQPIGGNILTFIQNKALNSQLALSRNTKNSLIRFSMFQYNISNVATLKSENNELVNLSSFNGLDFGVDFIPANQYALTMGTARVLGGDMIWTSKLKKSSYHIDFMTNASLFKSQAENSAAKTDVGYITNASIYLSLFPKVNRDLIFGLSHHLRGGTRELLLNNSGNPNNAFGSIYDLSSTFSDRLQDYSRIDFRIVYQIKRSSGKINRWSLDIQNIANQQNDSFRYFDQFTQTVVTQKQLGLIPVLGVRIEL